MGIMIIPFVSSMADDQHCRRSPGNERRQPGAWRDPVETIKQVLLPAALPGVVGGVLLAVSRAIGETMIVVDGRRPRRQPDRQSVRA